MRAGDHSGICYYERNSSVPLVKRATAEALGTMLLSIVVAGSVFSSSLWSQPGHVSGALAIPGALGSLILAFGPLSGGHFNPVFTLLQWLSGERDGPSTMSYVLAQVLGAALGIQLARLLFGIQSTDSSEAADVLRSAASEFIVSAGLVAVVLCCVRASRIEVVPVVAAGWLMACISAAPSSLANPALSFALLGASRITEQSVVGAVIYIVSQLAGGALAQLTINTLYRNFGSPVRASIDPVLASSVLGVSAESSAQTGEEHSRVIGSSHSTSRSS
ncbi:aquaporin [Microvirga terrae]|uniref:aquaporin n=1 Tax=Microvirga terrae TaxID=2740529 RepID=UPI00156FFB77